MDRGRLARMIPASADGIGWRSRGYLPHLSVSNLVQHIVFRVADSLPVRIRDEIAAYPISERTEAADAALDAGLGERDLENPAIAELVQRALLHFDGKRYALIAWCIMPNHVHVVAEMRSGHAIGRVVHAWKSFTVHAANRLLGRTHRFWAPEYFDRYMRDDEQLAATCAYVEENPVKAGLCKYPREWRFSSAGRR